MDVATALALVVLYWRDWVRIIRGLWTSIVTRKISNAEQRLGWLLVVGTIPVGIAGIALDSLVRNVLGKPVPTALFLALNGLVLFAVERLQHRRKDAEEQVSPDQTMIIPNAAFSSGDTAPLHAITAEPLTADEASERRLSKLQWKEAVMIGGAQALALLPGISRSGITIVAGLMRGLRHDDAARFAFLLATPVILGAGVIKMPELFKPEVHGSLGPALVGSIVAGLAAYVSARSLASYFETRTLNPFAIYCMVAGLGSLAYFLIAGTPA
jgi:undecaprenyl-diphosphatase